jgi:YbbR domain-containing protein
MPPRPSHRGSPGSYERRGWKAHGRAVLTERLGLKATALLIAVLLWLVVSARQPTESYVDVAVVPELDSTLALLDQPPHVRALVAGRAADVVKLYAARPIVHRRVDADAPDTLVLDITPADVHIPAELAGDVRVLEVQPRAVTLRFESKATRRVAVQNGQRVRTLLDTAKAAGRALPMRGVSLHFSPETVRITGSRAAVRRVSSVRPVPLAIAWGDTMPHLVDLDTIGLGVRVHPAQVKVVARPACLGADSTAVRCP